MRRFNDNVGAVDPTVDHTSKSTEHHDSKENEASILEIAEEVLIDLWRRQLQRNEIVGNKIGGKDRLGEVPLCHEIVENLKEIE